MKTYQSEQEFVNNFAKEAKESLKSGQNFEATVNGINVIVTDMDNNNASKVTMYTATTNGIAFSGSITALKKRLHVTYTKEYNRTGERAQSVNTKVVIKSDEELQRTADVSYDRLYNAVTSLLRIVNRFELSGILNENDICSIRNEGVICRGDDVIPVMELMMKKLKQERDEEIERREAEAKKKADEAAKREAVKKEILQRITEASADGNMSEVIRLSKELKQYM